MFIEFSIKNYRSFWKTQTISLAAGSAKELLENNTFKLTAQELPRLLRSAVLYGPNGGGKSNLIKALGFMQHFVLFSAKESQEGERIPMEPFRLHSNGPTRASEFEVVFIEGGIRYQYGFAATGKRVVHEWLFAFPGNRAQRWFERVYDPEDKKENWYFGTKLTGQKKTWQKSTRANALFLSIAVQLNSDQLKPVFNWFQRLVVIGHDELIRRTITANSCENKEGCSKVLNFLNNGGIEVDDITIEEKTLDRLNFPPSLPDELKNYFQNDLQGKSVKEVFFKHQLLNTDDFTLLPLTVESDGTQKLFDYASLWLDMLEKGLILIIDELNNSLHPHLVRYLLGLIHSSSHNKANGQLIFSTHDTSILDTGILRRDQIWFMEKDNARATQLYPLSDFHPRKKEALEKGYLQGRYGALPYIGEVKF